MTAKYKWTPEAIALVEDTALSTREVAGRLGVSWGVVGDYRLIQHIQVKGAHFKWTAEKEVLLYDTTLSNPEVAELVGCKYYQALRRRDVLGIWDTLVLIILRSSGQEMQRDDLAQYLIELSQLK